MKREIPKVTLGFFKDGLKVNSRKFHPLNMAFKDFKLETDKEYKPIDPMDLIESFSNINLEDAGKSDKVKALKALLDKVNL